MGFQTLQVALVTGGGIETQAGMDKIRHSFAALELQLAPTLDVADQAAHHLLVLVHPGSHHKGGVGEADRLFVLNAMSFPTHRPIAVVLPALDDKGNVSAHDSSRWGCEWIKMGGRDKFA
jgi:hypothetical protein